MITIQEYLLSKASKKLKDIVVATNDNLRTLVKEAIKENGVDADLNFIDTSKVTNMYALFEHSDFSGDISRWDVSNVKDMNSMFYGARMFNCDISEWDVSNVTDFTSTFQEASVFNQPLGKWKPINAVKMYKMFYYASKFKQDLSKWDVPKVNSLGLVFSGSAMGSERKLWPAKFIE